MATKKPQTPTNEAPQDNVNTTAAAGETKAAGAAPETGGDDTNTEDHPNPARAASDAAETAAAAATAEASKKAGKKTTPKAPADKPAAGQKGKDDPFSKLAMEYAPLYPGNKTFHITSDKQVFLSKNKADAEAHQRSLKGGQVTTVNID
jgi:hypothetical protein